MVATALWEKPVVVATHSDVHIANTLTRHPSWPAPIKRHRARRRNTAYRLKHQHQQRPSSVRHRRAHLLLITVNYSTDHEPEPAAKPERASHATELHSPPVLPSESITLPVPRDYALSATLLVMLALIAHHLLVSVHQLQWKVYAPISLINWTSCCSRVLRVSQVVSQCIQHTETAWPAHLRFFLNCMRYINPRFTYLRLLAFTFLL